MQSLKQGSLLQGGKYRIERTLGQGGFGITYSALQVALNRRVAIKEFFMKEYCERDANTSHVTLGTSSGAQEVKRFKEKFLKEAALIAQLNNPHIVRIHDIFEENGTAYYVMEFLEDRWSQFGKDGTPWELSLNIIRQIGDGLSYIHAQNVLHLDVKPSNILFREDCAVLIDFGISKRYDAEGAQTSSTPVGISKGYAPLEQYNQGVQKFQPATDIYSLGATFYKLLTGETPPEASDVMNYGLPIEVLRARRVPEKVISVIQKSMNPKVGQRYQSVSQFLDALGEAPTSVTWGKSNNTIENKRDEETISSQIRKASNNLLKEKHKSQDYIQKNKKKHYLLWIIIAAFIAVGIFILSLNSHNNKNNNNDSNELGLNTKLDSFAYAIGMAQTQGLKEYLVLEKEIDTTYMDEFKEGLLYVTGLKNPSNPDYEGEREKAYNEGIEVGNLISTEMISGINHEIFGEDSTKTISTSHFIEGFLDGIDGNVSIYTLESAMEAARNLMVEIKLLNAEQQYGDNKKAGEKFLEENKKNEGINVLPSGVQYKIIKQGTGKKPSEESRVTVNYEGRLLDGTIFDSSYERGEPATFRCNQVIDGWRDALIRMPAGSIWEVYIPQELAYGNREVGSNIKPFSMLIFKIELISVN